MIILKDIEDTKKENKIKLLEILYMISEKKNTLNDVILITGQTIQKKRLVNFNSQ